MEVERLRAVTSDHPFPIYEELVEHLVAAAAARDATVAHVLATPAALDEQSGRKEHRMSANI